MHPTVLLGGEPLRPLVKYERFCSLKLLMGFHFFFRRMCHLWIVLMLAWVSLNSSGTYRDFWKHSKKVWTSNFVFRSCRNRLFSTVFDPPRFSWYREGARPEKKCNLKSRYAFNEKFTIYTPGDCVKVAFSIVSHVKFASVRAKNV